MTALPSIVYVGGVPLRLGGKLGEGGEGVVYAVAGSADRVVKLYREPPAPGVVEKINAMAGLSSPGLVEVCAWPLGVVNLANPHRPAGFVMPAVVGHEMIQGLYNPAQRLKLFPRAGWHFQARSAHNLAAAFDEVHKAGCLVGDVNQSNALVSPQATIRLIDCDSFQVAAAGKRFLCEVGVAHYTPPELQGKALRGVTRTPNHDRFGLAVLIYQLLFVGRHPYQGVYSGPGEPEFEELIRDFRFSQGPRAASWHMAPAPHVPLLSDIPPFVGDLFRRAFEKGSDAGDARPTAAEWVAALKRLEPEISTCTADAGHTYWRGAGGCVWCRIAAGGGPEYYYGVSGGPGVFEVDETKLQDVLKRLASAELAVFDYDRSRFLPDPLPEPEPEPENVGNDLAAIRVLVYATLLSAVAMLGCCFRVYVGVIGLICTAIFGTWLGVLATKSPWRRELLRRRKEADAAERRLERLEADFADEVRGLRREQDKHAERARSLAVECRRLGEEFRREVKTIRATVEARALRQHLQLYPLADAEIPKIGSGRRLKLAAAGIHTAADVTEESVRAVKGFGDALTASLIAWRNEVARSFRFDASGVSSSAEQRRLVVAYRQRQSAFVAEMEKCVTTAAAVPAEVQTAKKAYSPRLKKAAREWAQARADLRVMGRG